MASDGHKCTQWLPEAVSILRSAWGSAQQHLYQVTTLMTANRRCSLLFQDTHDASESPRHLQIYRCLLNHELMPEACTVSWLKLYSP